MFVSIIIVIALSLLLFALIVAAERRFTRWRSPRDN
jgi:ABC-type nitrate/sulfonate/bicarbonate transport system permease component